MKQLDQTPINPKGFTNMNNIQGMFGTQVPNTFTRDINNPYNPTSPTVNNNIVATPPPPTGVDTPIVPPYDINNY